MQNSQQDRELVISSSSSKELEEEINMKKRKNEYDVRKKEWKEKHETITKKCKEDCDNVFKKIKEEADDFSKKVIDQQNNFDKKVKEDRDIIQKKLTDGLNRQRLFVGLSLINKMIFDLQWQYHNPDTTQDNFIDKNDIVHHIKSLKFIVDKMTEFSNTGL
ncbi:MAG: hypothetical protein Barrevirus12_14 [Barrevirus sp.]|uniref:Uncharacterized protein n=1 Tax=Barrevirus sp. TaxID=2487763 RepID=A0A3G4ZQE8_9VIRU|nr:MAG: hypothetical protein Barrevirus12_14 [Barrevirus sp.]